MRHGGRRIAAGVEGDAAVAPGEEPHLRLPGPQVAGIFVDEDQGRAGAGFLVIELDPVIRHNHRHVAFPQVPLGRG